jgi:SPP1 family predicted phage head-tail adaptor
MRAGQLRESIVIERPIESRNELGEFVRSWEPWATLRAAVEPVNFNESINRQQAGGAATHTVRTRWIAGLDTKMRIRWASRDDRILWISGAVERGNRQSWEITAEERA